MTDTPIRRATADDAAACAAICDGWIEETHWMPRTISRTDLEAALADGLPKREAYVIGEPVQGYLSMDPEEAHIWGFYIRPRGKGLGRALMDHVKQGRTRLQLNTHAANAAAHRFYRREGFVQVGEAWQGGDGIDEIRMEWRA